MRSRPKRLYLKMTDDSTRDRWATPQRVVDAVAKVLGGPPEIDLAASEQNAKAFRYVTEGFVYPVFNDECLTPCQVNLENGLFSLEPEGVAGESYGWAWLNPPYSRGNMERFTAWAAEYVEHGGTVALCHRPDFSTSWYQDNVLPHARMLLLPSKRIHFIPPDGIEGRSSNFAAVITVMQGGDREQMIRRLDV